MGSGGVGDISIGVQERSFFCPNWGSEAQLANTVPESEAVIEPIAELSRLKTDTDVVTGNLSILRIEEISYESSSHRDPH
jgi:hypothetical protein